MPDGTKPAPGGWNRFMLEVRDLDTIASELRAAGVKFRTDTRGVRGYAVASLR